jgi:hypothetical protein
MRRESSRIIFRVLSDDQPDDVADAVRNWVEKEMMGRDFPERDTEITVTIGLALP